MGNGRKWLKMGEWQKIANKLKNCKSGIGIAETGTNMTENFLKIKNIRLLFKIAKIWHDTTHTLMA